MQESGQITRLLQAASSGDEQARNSLFDSVYQELRVIARAHRRRWRGNETINTTALIHEAYVKLAGGVSSNYNDRTHFFATASKAMRQILINYAKRSKTDKRGNDAVRVTLSGNIPVSDDALDDLLIIDELLDQLEKRNVRHCRLFECRVFGGMTIEEAATALDISPATVKRDWRLISAWVHREVNQHKTVSTES